MASVNRVLFEGETKDKLWAPKLERELPNFPERNEEAFACQVVDEGRLWDSYTSMPGGVVLFSGDMSTGFAMRT